MNQKYSSRSGWLAGLGLALILSVAISTLLAQQGQEPESAVGSAPGQAAPGDNGHSYEVPEGDLQSLARFIDDLQNFRPSSRAEYMEHRQYAPPALMEAAERILALDPPEDSPAYLKATSVMLSARIPSLLVQPQQREETLGDVLDYLQKVDLGPGEQQMAISLMQVLENIDDPELELDTYSALAEVFGEDDDPGNRRLGEKFAGSVRRLQLLGNKLQLTDTTLDGDPVDWEAYRGKVVLVDFWATWCGPCLAEYPNVLHNYELYHERGFDVVGISLDESRAALESYLGLRQVPWTTLHNENGRSPTADYYGVSTIPTMILVDTEGNVVSLDARGPELDHLLAEMLGPPHEGEDAAAEGEASAAPAEEPAP